VRGDVAAFHRLDEAHHRARGAFQKKTRELLLEVGCRIVENDAVARQLRSNVALALFDTLFKAGDWERASRAMSAMTRSADAFPTELLLTILRSTRPAAQHLDRERRAFAERASELLRDRDPQRAERLLSFVL
jgi:hypothetical protein